MSREKRNGIVFGIVSSLVVLAAGGATALALDTRDKVVVSESRINGLEKRLDKIDDKLDTVLSRLPAR